MNDVVAHARRREKEYHLQYYSKYMLGEKNSWLSKPARYMIDSLKYLERSPHWALDLGCGVGRHAIELAHKYPTLHVDAVDILPEAIRQQLINARSFGVSERVHGLIQDIDTLSLERDYDYILSVSCVEHASTFEKFINLIHDVGDRTRPGGVNCFMIQADHKWTELLTGSEVQPITELNLSVEDVTEDLKEAYKGWNIVDLSTKPWHTVDSTGDVPIKYESTCVQFTAKKEEIS